MKTSSFEEGKKREKMWQGLAFFYGYTMHCGVEGAQLIMSKTRSSGLLRDPRVQ